MPLDISRLDRFIAVVDHGSINRAARETGISQAGLTKSIRILESQLDAILFERSARGVVLTRHGHAFLQHARVILNQRAAAVSAVRAQSEGVDVTLRVGIAPRWVLRTVIPDIITRFVQDNRRPAINIISGQHSWQMIERLQQGDLDILVATPSELDDLSDIESQPVLKDFQGIIVRRNHPLAKKRRIDLPSLAPYDWISGSAETFFRRYLSSLYLSKGLSPPKPLIVADSNVLILDVIARTDLLGIATQQLINVDHAESIVMLKLPDQVKRETAILTRSNVVLPDTARDLIGAITEALEMSV